MRIAFDLDNLLIPYSNAYCFEVEKRTLMRRLLRTEPLRKGTIDLFKGLSKGDHEIWIYTSSYRPKNSIRKTFYAHDLILDGIINQNVHNKQFSHSQTAFSKFPPAFGIDLLVDDSKGLQIEGEKGNFQTLILAPQDEQWTKVVLDRIAKMISAEKEGANYSK